jgi:O-antigen/teichoic acid export membrane protein
MNYYLIRKKQYKAIAVNKVTRRTFEGITQTILGNVGKKTGLFIGDIIGNIANIISAVVQIKIRNLNINKVSISEMRKVLKKYYSFPVYQVVPGLLNTVSLLLPVFLINSFFGANMLSHFHLSSQVLAAPLALISLSVSQVLLKDIAERRQNKQYVFKSIFKIAGYLLLIVLPIILVIYFWAPWIFSLIFSEKWETSGDISQIVIFSFAIQFIVSPLSSVLTALEKLKVVAVWQIFYFIMIIGLFWFRDMALEDFLWLFTIINLFSYTVYFILILYFARKYDKNLFKFKSGTLK